MLIVAMSLVYEAQVERGTITGTVTDTNAAVVTEATVRVIEESTNRVVTLQTDSAGQYSVANLTPGSYTIEMVGWFAFFMKF